MKFDSAAFKKAKFTARTEDVPVPDMAGFFTGLKPQEIPVWTVRGLTGNELGNCNESAERNRKIGAILEGLVSPSKKDISKAVKDMCGIGDNVPQDIAKRISILVTGSVKPKIDQELAVKICKTFPIEFFQLTTKITLLTGQGHVPGKPRGSGKGKT
jgi:hypothetical protein